MLYVVLKALSAKTGPLAHSFRWYVFSGPNRRDPLAIDLKPHAKWYDSID